MPKRKIKTKQSQLEAIQRYNSRHDRITLTLPAGTKEKIAEITDKSINRYIADLICVSLDNCTETELNCIDENRPITDTDKHTNDVEQYKTVKTDTGETYTSTIVSTGQNNVLDLFD